MKPLSSSTGALVAFLIAWLACPRASLASLAYIDPGTGSYLLQLLIAGLLGGLFALKLFWAHVKASVARLFSKGKADGDEEP